MKVGKTLWGVNSPNAEFVWTKRSKEVRVLLASLALLLCLACPKPPTGTLDVRNVNDSAVPQWIKDRILWDSGIIIGKYLMRDPNGQLVPNPDYPTGNIVVIRAATTNWPANTAASSRYLNRIFFGEGDDRSADRSIAEYYKENSYGQFTPVSGGIPGWVNLNAPLANYGDIESNPSFAQAVLQLANVDWNALDADGDQMISRAEAQIVMLIPNGSYVAGYASTRYIPVGLVQTPNGSFNFGTRRIVFFSLMSTTALDASTNPIRYHSTVIHELNHALFELVDRYGGNPGTGQYDIMVLDQNWMHLTMYDKIKIGWVQPKILNTHLSKTLIFPSSENRKAALVLVKPVDLLNELERIEYWVVEYRKRNQSGGDYDADFPEDGLAVWYVSEGTGLAGYDDVRLVDASLPDQDPDLYANPGAGALFKPDAKPWRLLIDADGEWSRLWFRSVSIPGFNITAEF